MSTDLKTLSRKELYSLTKRHLVQLATLNRALIHWNFLIKGAAALSHPNQSETAETVQFMTNLVTRAVRRKREIVVSMDGLRTEVETCNHILRDGDAQKTAAELFREQAEWEGRTFDERAKI